MRVHSLAMALLVPSLVFATTTGRRAAGPVKGSKEAKAIAERETGGKAVTAKRIPLNGASGGWEVDVRMPNESQGYRCVIDADTHMVHTKTRIPQPGKGETPTKVVHGTR